MSLETITSEWTQHPFKASWVKWVRDTHRKLTTPNADAPEAWRQLAMIFGDSGGPELCAVAAMHAMNLSQEVGDKESFRSAWAHVGLALRDLKVLPIEGSVIDTVRAWLKDFLSPLGGDVAQGAELCLRLALIRAGLIGRPDPMTVEAVRTLSVPDRESY